ncbi:MAG TPA: hypothetical protein VNO30_42215 [Kofleriaceae bacterium]|nr:hypothetical protein [Kofleriaceae bacterium]
MSRRFLICACLLAAPAACKGSTSSPAAGAEGSGSAARSAEPAGSAAGAPAGSAVGAPAGSAVGAPTASAAGASSAGSAAPAPAAAGAAARPQAFLDFEAVILPLLREPEGEARSRKTCKQLMTLQTKARGLARSKPPGVDEAAWQAAYEDVSGSLHGLAPNCNDDPPDDSSELPGLYKSYLRLTALLPGASSAGK